MKPTSLFSKPSLKAMKSFYVGYSLVLAIASIARGFWSAPAARWQADFWFIKDIDLLLSGKLDQVVWFTWGGGQATNGYRWFSYLSSVLFKFDPQVEIIVYGLVLFALSLMLGSQVVPQNGLMTRRSFLVSLLIPTVLFSLIGSYPRGMELGTFTGLVIMIWFVNNLAKTKTKTKESYLVQGLVAAIVGLLLFFIFMGGYALGLTFALILVALFQRFGIRKPNRILELSTVVYTCTSALFALSLRLASSTEEASAISKLMSQVESNSFFIPTFLLSAPSAGLVTSQTLENVSQDLSIPLVCCSSILLLIYSSYLVRKTSTKHTVGNSLAPQILFSYGLGTALMLLLFRPNDQLQLLNPWYALHFKVMICSIISLSILINERNGIKSKVSGRLISIASVLIFLVAVSASYVQYVRQNSEREYFLNVAAVELYPKLLNSESTMTPLILPYAESINAIRILKKHSLSPYSVSAKISKILGGKEGILLGGSSFGDGWVGKDSKLITLKASCKKIQLMFDVPNFIKDQSLILTVGSKRTSLNSVQLKSAIEIDEMKVGEPIHMTFGVETIPAKIGINDDQRALSAHLLATCN